MPNLKLAKLPDRKPVKITITVSAELNASLQAYAATYRETYGDAEEVSELIPYMVEQFLAADRAFAKSQKGIQAPRTNGGREAHVK
ncbi:MAG: DUF2274 domain-containing protein [Alphaproteobacteria bacterium]|nr:DUF2274 domain-containing protein [Alphaproteobacteria bacterium]